MRINDYSNPTGLKFFMIRDLEKLSYILLFQHIIYSGVFQRILK